MSVLQRSEIKGLFQGQGFSFLLPELPKGSPFPPGFVAPEDEKIFSKGGEFIGGTGLVMYLSYLSTPVGSYDELLYAPGSWGYADGSIGMRITRIFVSTEQAAVSGRKFLNTPKQVAVFSKIEDGEEMKLSAFLPSSTTPFFEAKMKRPQVFHTTADKSTLVYIQPPLNASSSWGEGTEKWAIFKADLKVEQRVVELNGLLGNMVNFPSVEVDKALELECLTIIVEDVEYVESM